SLSKRSAKGDFPSLRNACFKPLLLNWLPRKWGATKSGPTIEPRAVRHVASLPGRTRRSRDSQSRAGGPISGPAPETARTTAGRRARLRPRHGRAATACPSRLPATRREEATHYRRERDVSADEGPHVMPDDKGAEDQLWKSDFVAGQVNMLVGFLFTMIDTHP